MLVKLIAILKFLKWPYFVVTEIIGLAGIPGDVDMWGVRLIPFMEIFDYWIVRAALVISGILAVTYPKWLPWLRNRTRQASPPPEPEATNAQAEPKSKLLTEPQATRPNVTPLKYGTRDFEEGLFLKNIGEAAAYDVTLGPFRLGLRTVSFEGAEVPLLEPGETCFFYPKPHGHTTILPALEKSRCALFAFLRTWQYEIVERIEDARAKLQGSIRYKDQSGAEHETICTIGVDVCGDNGLVVRACQGSLGSTQDDGV